MAGNFVINQGTQTSVYTTNNGGTEIGIFKLDIGSGSNLQDFGGTIKEVTNIAGGTVTVGSIANLGSVTNIGTLVGVGTLSNVGSVNTVTSVTTVANVANGTFRMSVGTITTGSLTDLANLYSGSMRMTVGTVTTGTLQNLATGTINALAAGTITGGTLQNLNYGTMSIDAKPAGSAILTTHTLGTGGGTFVGTMIAPVGAGTYIYLTGISIIGRSGGSIDVGLATNVAGTTGAGVIARGLIPTAGGGLVRDFNPAIRIGTNGTLAYFLVTAGTADFTAQYWVGP